MNDFNTITYHTARNYGAVLQAFGLQAFLRELGYSTAIFDFRPPYVQRRVGMRAKAVSLLQGLHKSDFEEQRELFAKFSADHLPLTTERSCRVFLTGSDQVWNPSGSMNPMFFLQFAEEGCLRASYAASMGKAFVPDEKRDLFSRYINSMDAISVRETDVEKLLQQIFPGKIHIHIDPTLLHDKAFWRQYARPVSGLPERFTLVYLLHTAKNRNRLLRWLKQETSDEIVLLDSDGFHSLFTNRDKTVRAAGPAEFLWLIDHAQRVVTTSFHGTAFSLIFEKELYSLRNPASPSRASCLLEKMGMKTISEDEECFERQTGVDWAAVHDVLAMERERSAEYLNSLYRRAVSEEHKTIRGNVEQMKVACTGCSACATACPTEAIRMLMNQDGFFEPRIDVEKCLNCGKCLRLCPQVNQLGCVRKEVFWGAARDDGIRDSSTSGGVMRSLADTVLREGGVVFGAAFSEDHRSVIFTDTDHAAITALQRSKYTVSEIGSSFREVRDKLAQGRSVMFCGTPCQCAGLRAYLEKEEPRLLICDFVCGGIPSLCFYQEHLQTLENQYNSKIASVVFRPKTRGWGKLVLEVRFENGKKYAVRGYQDAYYKAFGILHTSVCSTCLQCRYSYFHASDVTMADFWGYKAVGVPFDAKGLSLISANTEKGRLALAAAEGLELHPLEMKYSDYAFRAKSPDPMALAARDQFFASARELGSFEKAFFASNRVGLTSQLIARGKRILHLK